MNRGTTMRGLLVAFALMACDKGPVSTYIEMTTSAQMGDKKGFLKGFTKTSATLVDANITLTEAYGMNEFNPFQLIVFDTVDGEPEVYEKGSTIGKKYRCGKPSCAVLLVRTNKRKRKILMVKEEGNWGIDMKELAQFWKTEKKTW